MCHHIIVLSPSAPLPFVHLAGLGDYLSEGIGLFLSFCFSVLSSKNCVLFAQITFSISCPHACINSLFSSTLFSFPFSQTCHIKDIIFLAIGLLSDIHSNVCTNHGSGPRHLLWDFDILYTSRCYWLWCSSWYIASFFPSPIAVSLSTLDPSPSLWPPGSHSLLCHRMSSCLKTHNPVRSWHGHVLLMPVKNNTASSQGRFTICSCHSTG